MQNETSCCQVILGSSYNTYYSLSSGDAQPIIRDVIILITDFIALEII